MKTSVMFLCALGFSSCMPMGMMGTDEMNRANEGHANIRDTMLEKQVIAGPVRAIAVFPVMHLGEKVQLTLRLEEVGTGAPIRNARVELHAEYENQSGMKGSLDAGSTQLPDRIKGIDISQEVPESSTAGLYRLAYQAFPAGQHTLMFHVSAIGDRTMDPELIVEGKRTVEGEDRGSHGSMSHGRSNTAALIVGAGIMAAIMLAMLNARHGMF